MPAVSSPFASAPDRPIVVLGAARSGTTLIADTLARHPAVAYWSEPQYVWRYGHAYRCTDVLDERDATPEIRARIRSRFEAYRARRGRQRFMEKTPSNCLRLPFVMAVLPDAKVVHVLRDGRDVALSAMLEWTGTGIPRRADGTRTPMGPAGKLRAVARDQIRFRDRVDDLRSLWELPAYLPRGLNVLKRYVVPGSEALWGPRIPGLREVRRTYSLLETCAVQWDVCSRMARSACRELPTSRVLEFRYEDLTLDPAATFERILEFVELDRDDALVDHARSVIEPQVGRWRSKMSQDDAVRVERLVGDSLRALGYPLLTDGDDGPAVGDHGRPA